MDTVSAHHHRFQKIPGMNCFACAPAHLNTAGLNLFFEVTPRGVKAPVSLPPHFQSYPGFLHGGVLTAVLDETMAYAGIAKRGKLPFTKTIEIQYRKAVPPLSDCHCFGVLLEERESGFRASGTIENSKGQILVSARAEFVEPKLEMAQKLLGENGVRGLEYYFW